MGLAGWFSGAGRLAGYDGCFVSSWVAKSLFAVDRWLGSRGGGGLIYRGVKLVRAPNYEDAEGILRRCPRIASQSRSRWCSVHRPSAASSLARWSGFGAADRCYSPNSLEKPRVAPASGLVRGRWRCAGCGFSASALVLQRKALVIRRRLLEKDPEMLGSCMVAREYPLPVRLGERWSSRFRISVSADTSWFTRAKIYVESIERNFSALCLPKLVYPYFFIKVKMPHIRLREPSENTWTASSFFLIHTYMHAQNLTLAHLEFSTAVSASILFVVKLCLCFRFRGMLACLWHEIGQFRHRSCTATILSRFLGVFRSGYSADAENLPRRWWLLSAGLPGVGQFVVLPDCFEP